MPDISQAQTILAALGMPAAQQNEMSALTLLALCGLKPETDWSLAKQSSLTVTKGIMAFVRDFYGRDYAPNTRETFRRQVLHQFVQGKIAVYNPDDPSLPTNSPRAHYAISEAALTVVRAYGTEAWEAAAREFKETQGSLITVYQSPRENLGTPVHLPDGTTLILSPGEHNQLQAGVIEQFAPRFVSGGVLLYLGDAADKDFYVAADRLATLQIPFTEHDKLPDIILYDAAKNWLFLMEVVTSHGPMTPQRVVELGEMLRNCDAGKIFVTAFPTFVEFRRHIKDIAWETEVWIAEVPDHLIHFNGDRFLGPR